MNKNSFKSYGTNIFISTFEEPVHEVITGKNFKIRFGGLNELNRREVIIDANSIYRAQFVCDLIICSMLLFEDLIYNSIRDFAVYPMEPNNNENISYEGIKGYCSPNIPIYCELAAKISFHRQYINAIIKYMLSCEIHSNNIMDLDPFHNKNIPLSPFPYDHMRYGYAIIVAYSILEELNLGINASSKRPSLINGEWNNEVKDDLVRRLFKAKININDPILWTRRGSKNRLEKKRNLTPLKKASWAYGNVRDCEILIIDAINYISWLRSRIASHKVHRDIRLLSVYDVANAQHLARRLLLESLGFWNMDEKKISRFIKIKQYSY